MLHILNKPPNGEASAQMLATVAAGDSILLIEEAVQALLHADWPGWQIAADVHLFVLEEDAASRGITPPAADHRARRVDMAGFVALTEQHPTILSWY